jgi:hypothetical protein
MREIQALFANCTKIVHRAGLQRMEDRVEPTNPTSQDFVQLMGITTSVMGLVATATVCEAIIGHWRTFGGWNRLLAVFFVLILVLVPLGLVFKEKTWVKSLEALGKANLLLAYCWVLLGTRLFNNL